MRKDAWLWIATAAILAVALVPTLLSGERHISVVLAAGIAASGLLYWFFKRLGTPLWMQVFAAAFILAAWILGDVFSFYGNYEWWDLLLHGTAGVLLALIIAQWLQDLDQKLRYPLAFLSVMGLGALWELWEWAFKVNQSTGPAGDVLSDLAIKATGAAIALAMITVYRGSFA